MSIKDKPYIKILNYGFTSVAIQTSSRGYLIPPSDGITPSVEFLTLQDIEYVNSRTGVFKTGILVFEDDERDEVYEVLKLFDWENTVFTEKIIDDIILNPTQEKISKIISIKDNHTISRIYGKLMYFLESGKHDISNRISQVINERYLEIRNGSVTSKIITSNADTQKDNEIDILKKQNDDMQNKLNQMEEMMKQFMDMSVNKAQTQAKTVPVKKVDKT